MKTDDCTCTDCGGGAAAADGDDAADAFDAAAGDACGEAVTPHTQYILRLGPHDPSKTYYWKQKRKEK